MSAQHTPGPWKKSDRLNGPWWHISSGHSVGGQECGSGRQAIACVHGESKRGAKAYAEMFEANARLIAAAPDLLRLLRMARTQLDSNLQELTDCHTNPVTGLVDDAEVLLVIESEQDLINQIDDCISRTGIAA